MKSRIVFCVLLILLACSKEEPEPAFTPLPEVDIIPEVREYVDWFFEESKKKGLSLDESKVVVQVSTIEELGGMAGRGGSNRIRIAKDYWSKASKLMKEQLVFHELGHAVLGRVHTQETLPDCTYKSLMRGEHNYPTYTSQTDPRREYYLSELFDPNIKYPSWAKAIKLNKNSLLANDVKDWEFVRIDVTSQVGTISPDKSLHISSEAGGYGSASWKLKIPTDNVPVGATLVIAGRVKYSNITGRLDVGLLNHTDIRSEENPPLGSALSMYADDFGRISGTSDGWIYFTLTYNCYPANKPDMHVFLIATEDKNSDAWIKDVTVDYYN